VAFPAISTGVYRFPPDRAARIAVGTVTSELAARAGTIRRVVFCCFSDDIAAHHRDAFVELGLG
jgi:O-acetyl-ADP-ribose deacetylase (regulator of RNase III)